MDKQKTDGLTMDKWIYIIWAYPEVTPQGQWIILITDKGLVFSTTLHA